MYVLNLVGDVFGYILFVKEPYSLWVTNHMNNAAHVQTAASPNPKHTEVCLWRESWDLEVAACFIYLFIF